MLAESEDTESYAIRRGRIHGIRLDIAADEHLFDLNGIAYLYSLALAALLYLWCNGDNLSVISFLLYTVAPLAQA